MVIFKTQTARSKPRAVWGSTALCKFLLTQPLRVGQQLSQLVTLVRNQVLSHQMQ